jgi:hypothetical protein
MANLMPLTVHDNYTVFRWLVAVPQGVDNLNHNPEIESLNPLQLMNDTTWFLLSGFQKRYLIYG